MFQSKAMLFLCVETPLHAGTGRSLGTVDLPIQRERVTGYPIVQASSIKGRLRAETDPHHAEDKYKLDEDIWLTIFGPETGNAADYAGALSTGDARILLFPVRSLAGVFAWVTCVDVLSRFRREAIALDLKLNDGERGDFVIPTKPGDNFALVATGELKADASTLVLEEFSFKADDAQKVKLESLAKWLANHVLPEKPKKKEGEKELADAYEYWRTHLVGKLCILPENAFRDFVLYSTEVQTHIALDPGTKTVKSEEGKGALWTSESLPPDTILYAPIIAHKPRKDGSMLEPATMITAVSKLPRMHLGGDETTGQGVVALRFVEAAKVVQGGGS
jgi:CRISPR-associated protein Cmr4